MIATVRSEWLETVVNDALNERVTDNANDQPDAEPAVSEAFKEELLKHPVIPGKHFDKHLEANLFFFPFRIEERKDSVQDLLL